MIIYLKYNMSVVGSRSNFGRVNYKRFHRKKGDKVVRNKDFNRKVSTAMNKLAETKHKDYVLDAFVSTTPIIASAFNPIQDVTDTGRTGDFLRVKSVKLRFMLLKNTVAVIPSRVRIMLVQWYNETTPLIQNIIQNTTLPVSLLSYPSFDRVRDNNDLRILYDRTFTLGDNISEPSGVNVNTVLRGFKNKVYFTSAGSTPTNGQFYFIYMSDVLLTGNPPQVTASARFLYTDY